MNGNASNDNARYRRTVFIRRHSLSTRLTHWLNALCLSFLLLSGLQIFNAHPELYWGHYGGDGDRAVLTIGSEGEGAQTRGFLRVAGMQFATTGVLGVSDVEGEPISRAFPPWATIPSFQDLAAGRRWHFFFAWLFLLNGIFYLGFSVLSGHFRRDLAPTTRELSPRHLWHEVLDHARLRFPEGEDARRYNALQKLTYLAVIGVMFVANVVGGWWWGGNFFFFWVALIWGVVLVVQASRLFGGHIGREWEDRMVDHIMSRRRGTYTPYRSAYRPGPIVTPPPAEEPPAPPPAPTQPA